MRITLGHVLVSRVIFHGRCGLRLAFKVIHVVDSALTFCFNARVLATIIDVAYQLYL